MVEDDFEFDFDDVEEELDEDEGESWCFCTEPEEIRIQLERLGEKLQKDLETCCSTGITAKTISITWEKIDAALKYQKVDWTPEGLANSWSGRAVPERIAEIGWHYLPGEGYLPDDEDVAQRWLQIASWLGSLPAYLLLVKYRMLPVSAEDEGDPRAQAFFRWRESLQEDTEAGSTRKEQLESFPFLDALAIELGLRAALARSDKTLARQVVAVMDARKIQTEELMELRAKALILLSDQKPQEEIRILQEIKPANDSKEVQEVLKRYTPLLTPVPLRPWPRVLGWSTQLQREYPNMVEIIDDLERSAELAISMQCSVVRFRPLLLLGPAGVGKSRFARRLGAALGVPSQIIPLAGMSDSMLLKGNSRGWSNARTGAIVDFLLKTQVGNPLVCLDEIDKIGVGMNNGRVWEWLLTLLEAETASQVLDEFLMAPVNYSAINWIATANDVSELPDPLLSRFRIVRIPPLGGESFPAVFRGILGDIAREYQVAPEQLPSLPAEVVEKTRQAFARNPRSIRALAGLVRKLVELQAQAEAPQCRGANLLQ
ncbi:AAA domain-containing protein [Acidithiobacillus sp. CV18-2]|nr:AAA domain-containing protein [Acidithiobacillus sp. CV18-3]MBU2757996.1 AAA domain-containing protein [Acidithiobacillus sp. BN09-2]MBU2776630.1 AAA domain-containing protein [Acidithiobacillus sp. CV18-2]MBU2798643.1 AAA domain-containing protein [Acidithiobacillus sp. VAN18-4]UTV82072.1 AAA family ATPase [Acidithiobacillus sp. YTS05]